MTRINVKGLAFRQVNEKIEQTHDRDIVLENVCGQRYIGAGSSGRHLVIEGVPGNALGAYLDGTTIEVSGNAQDATGDTMNDGDIIVNGSSGDATGYAMRGGRIFVRGSVGYRAGIHMKAYKDKIPAVVIGGEAGCFLGEYQAGGRIVVLGLDTEGRAPVDAFYATGMHGGVIYLRSDVLPDDLPPQVVAHRAGAEDLADIEKYVLPFCQHFGLDVKNVMDHNFFCLKPNTNNPYKQLYTQN